MLNPGVCCVQCELKTADQLQVSLKNIDKFASKTGFKHSKVNMSDILDKGLKDIVVNRDCPL